MTSTRRCVGRGALLFALMAGSPALLGGVAQADVLGDTGTLTVPLPVAVPLVGEPATSASPSPSPSPTETAPAAQQQETTVSTADTSSSVAEPQPAPAADESVTASSDNAPEPVPAPAMAPTAPSAPVTTGQQPVRVDGSVGAQPAQPTQSSGELPSTAVPAAAAAAAAASVDAAAGYSLAGGAAPGLSSGLLELPGLPGLEGLRAEHGLGRQVAARLGQAPLVAPEAAGGDAAERFIVVRSASAAQNQPAKPVGVVLFVMAAAAAAAGSARLRMWRRVALS
ncbi:MAG: hypothetical protein JJD92_13575 [Frankiaceae bacterium]|nr:hypothetical protein [Frankiaceae bacterium]